MPNYKPATYFETFGKQLDHIRIQSMAGSHSGHFYSREFDRKTTFFRQTFDRETTPACASGAGPLPAKLLKRTIYRSTIVDT